MYQNICKIAKIRSHKCTCRTLTIIEGNIYKIESFTCEYVMNNNLDNSLITS